MKDMPPHYEKFLTDIWLINISDIFMWMCFLAIIFGGVIPFIPQYLEIKKSEDSEGFSMHVCLVLIMSNLLRIFFWFGKYYEYPLLFQSVVMIITMLVMVHLCVLIRKKFLKETHLFTDFEMKYFWKWTDFSSYLQFILLFLFFGSIITYLLSHYQVYVESVGTLAVVSEAILGFPQLYRNHMNKSTLGMSTKMVFMWFMGDFFKTMYFLLRKAPIQFWLCGFVQIMIDMSILYQVWLYKNNAPTGRRKTLSSDS